MAKKTKEKKTNTRIIKGDEVRVLRGKATGKTGKVNLVLRKNRYGNELVLIQGVNLVKRHQKPNQKSKQGGIVEKEMPIHISNVIKIGSGEKRKGSEEKAKKAE